MMPFIRFFFSLATLIGLVVLLSTSLQVKDKTLPPIGPFINSFSGFWRNAEPVTGPLLAPQLKLSGLKDKVEVIYDDLMVPHIFAQSVEDAARVQGYITAQNRLFQMDVTARKAGGRLSEVLGASTLALDKEIRRRGLPWAAERDLEVWKKDPQTMAMLQSYAEGVNEWIRQLTPADYPIEYKLLNFKPEDWTAFKSVLVVEAMADMLSSYNRDEGATNTLALLGRADYNFLFPDWNPKQTPVVVGDYKPSASKNSVTTPPIEPTSVEKGVGAIQMPASTLPTGETPPFTDEAHWYPDPPINGSNNWAVAGSRTLSGHPMLSNDPHLSLTLPSIWYQVQWHTPEVNCYGVSLPGLPGVVIGFNEHLAWGITNVGSDVSDWYRVQWADPARMNYVLDGKSVAATLRVETIGVKGRENAVLDTVRYTVWGPVVHDDPKHSMHDCAYRWVAHDAAVRNTLSQFFQLNKAASQKDYDSALVGFDCPGQNFAMADQAGEIGIRVSGFHLVRTGEDGRYIRDGSKSSEAWPDYLPQSDVPKMYNPERGFIYSSNQNSVSVDDPRFAKYGDWDQYRGRRSFQRLSAMHGATIDSMKSMQNDNFSIRASDALPVMLKLLDRNGLNPAAQAIVADLEGWDYRYEKDKTAPTLFEMWFDSTYIETWDEINALRLKNVDVLFPEVWKFLELLEKDTSNRFFDNQSTPEKEQARQIVNLAFGQMCKQAAIETLKGNLAYGKFKGFHIPHITRRIPSFGRFDVVVGGHRSALNAIQANHGPSWRMIVDLGDEVKGYGVFPGGQSGNPGSRFYDNMVNTWAEGAYNDLLFLKNSDPASAGKRLLTKQTFSAN